MDEELEVYTTVTDTENDGEVTDDTENDGIHVRFNHEDRILDKSEAAVLAQKGLNAERFMNSLKTVAAARNCTVGELVNSLVAEDENGAREKYLSATGDEEIADKLMELRKNELEEIAGSIEGEESKEIEKIIAEGIEELKSDKAGVNGIEDIPDSVLRSSVENDTPLALEYYKDAYLRLKAVREAELNEAAAADASAGSLFSPADIGTTPEIEAMMKGIWG